MPATLRAERTTKADLRISARDCHPAEDNRSECGRQDAATQGEFDRRYATIPTWCAISGMNRTTTYYGLTAGNLRAKKVGRRTLIDVEHGLRWIASQPDAVFRSAKAA